MEEPSKRIFKILRLLIYIDIYNDSRMRVVRGADLPFIKKIILIADGKRDAKLIKALDSRAVLLDSGV